jgi:hypothetical protein
MSITSTLTAAQYQDMILAEVGDTISGPVGSRILTIWDMFAAKTPIYLQYLYAKVKAIDILLGPALAGLPTLTVGRQTVDEAKYAEFLLKLKAATNEEIDREEMGNRLGEAGQITQTAPIMPPDPLLPIFDPFQVRDANSPLYRGDPYRTRRSLLD